MNFKTRPFLLTTGICLILQTILFTVATGALILTGGQSFPVIPRSNDVQTQGLSLIITLGFCLCLFGMDMLGGALYAFWGTRQPPFGVGDGVLGGAAASALASLGSSLVGLCLSLIALFLTNSQGDSNLLLAGSLIAVPLTLLYDIGYVVMAAILGAVGGAVATKLAGPKPVPPAA